MQFEEGRRCALESTFLRTIPVDCPTKKEVEAFSMIQCLALGEKAAQAHSQQFIDYSRLLIEDFVATGKKQQPFFNYSHKYQYF